MASRAAGAGYRSHLYTDALRMIAGLELIAKSGCKARLRECKQICCNSSLYDYVKTTCNSATSFSTVFIVYQCPFFPAYFKSQKTLFDSFFQNPLSNKKTTSNQNPQSDGSKSQGKPTSSPGTASANPNQSQTRSFHTLLYDSFFSDTSSHTNPILNFI